MIKILLIVSSLSGGGAEHVARKNLESILGRPDILPAILLREELPHQLEGKVKFYKLPYQNKGELQKKVETIFGSIRKEKEYLKILMDFRPDIIHLHNYLLFSPSLISAIRKYRNIKGCKVVITHHTYSWICGNDMFYNQSKKAVCEECSNRFDLSIIMKNCSGSYLKSGAKYLNKRNYKKIKEDVIDYHIAPSQFLLKKFLDAIPGIKIKVIRNPCIDEIKNLPAIESRKDEIVYFGRLSHEKNIVTFAENFLNTKTSLRLKIVGEGPLSRALVNLEKRSNGRIVFLKGFMETNDLYGEVGFAKFFILPSAWYENSPVSIIEAINWGIVPIVPRIGGMNELIDLFGCGIAFTSHNLSEFDALLKQYEINYKFEYDKLLKARNKLKLFLTQTYQENIIETYCSIYVE